MAAGNKRDAERFGREQCSRVQLEAGDSILSSTQLGVFKAVAPQPLQILLFGKQGALHRWH